MAVTIRDPEANAAPVGIGVEARRIRVFQAV
jgi:hypothetical protein